MKNENIDKKSLLYLKRYATDFNKLQAYCTTAIHGFPRRRQMQTNVKHTYSF